MTHSATAANDWYSRLGIGAAPRGVSAIQEITHSDGQEKYHALIEQGKIDSVAHVPIGEAIETGQW